MPDLPARPDLDQLRHQAKDLLHAAHRGDPGATARIGTVSRRLILSSAQLALAREYGFASWAKLKLEVERRDILNSRDLSRLTRLLAEHPGLATAPMEHWADRQDGEPLGYITMMRFNHERLGLPRELPGTGAIARALIDAGAPVNGHPGDKETPLITAASSGDADVARVLIEAGADKDFDKVIVVTCGFEQKVERFAQRTNVPLQVARAEVERRSAAQFPDSEKARRADYVVDNSGSADDTERQVERIWQELLRIESNKGGESFPRG